MKARITDVKVFVVDAYRTNWVFVKVFTADGVTGVGEGSLEMSELAVAAILNGWRDELVGKDAFQVERIIEQLHRDSYWRMGVVHRSALSAVEAALMDIKGKTLGVPVYDLLGGRQRDAVKCYLNGWFVDAADPGEFAEKALVASARGFTGLKWDPFGSSYLELTPRQSLQTRKCVEAVRAAVGGQTALMIEMHGRFDVPNAVRAMQLLEDLQPYWFEEPVPPESLRALGDVKRRIAAPIASGERISEFASFVELLAQDAIDHYQPDVCHVGGMSELKRIAAIAHARFRPVSPHNPMGPIANAMTLQVVAAIPNFGWLETMQTDVPWRAEVILGEDLHVHDGSMAIPQAPGLGIDIDESACEKHPYQPHPLRHYKGSLTNIRPVNAVPFYRATCS